MEHYVYSGYIVIGSLSSRTKYTGDKSGRLQKKKY